MTLAKKPLSSILSSIVALILVTMIAMSPSSSSPQSLIVTAQTPSASNQTTTTTSSPSAVTSSANMLQHRVQHSNSQEQATSNNINSPSSPNTTPTLLSKGNTLSSSFPLMIDESNVQKQEQQLNHIVHLNQIVGGGPPPDGIPSIDNPKFVTIQQAGSFISDSDFVVGVNINSDIRAYPLSILVWHEIVNDKVGGIPVAVTYCPL